MKWDIEHDSAPAHKLSRFNELKKKFEEHEKEQKIRQAEREKREAELEQLKSQLFKTNDFKKLNPFSIKNAYYLYDYHPKRDWDNSPDIERFSRFILSVKHGDSEDVDKMTRKLNSLLNISDSFTLCVVPPHNCSARDSGIKLIAKKLCAEGSTDGTECLKRIKDIPAQHESINRLTKSELKASLAVEHEELIKGKNVLLLDDISTTGNSLESARELLREHYPESIICVVLAKTKSD
ncbi:MAG: ComF family protein [Candidatus Nanoarchaeia archaeon]